MAVDFFCRIYCHSNGVCGFQHNGLCPEIQAPIQQPVVDEVRVNERKRVFYINEPLQFFVGAFASQADQVGRKRRPDTNDAIKRVCFQQLQSLFFAWYIPKTAPIGPIQAAPANIYQFFKSFPECAMPGR